MKIKLVNVNDDKFDDILSKRVDNKGKEVVFFDWVPTHQKSNAVITQIKEMKRCQDNHIPVIVFDRYSSMTDDEIVFLLKKTKALLFEPSINTRPGFSFLPYWVHLVEYSFDLSIKRRFQTGYKGNVFTNDLELNILSVVKDKLIIGVDSKIPPDKYKVLKSIIVFDKFEYEDLSTMIITGTEDDYVNGTLPDIRQALYNGVVPLLYHKHKWFHSLFRHFVMYSGSDIRWAVNMYETCAYGFLEDINKNIIEYLPEMEAGNFINNLIEKAEKL